MTTKALVVPAAGSGSRLNKEIPKPYLQLSGRTILEHTIRRFLPIDGLRQVIVATSAEYLETAQQILQVVLTKDVSGRCLTGGQERQDSIYNALSEVSDVDLVIVHDAVRPFVKYNHIKACCEAAANFGASVLGVPAKDTIKRIDEQKMIVETPARKYLWQAQTPQIFRKEIIVDAYQKARATDFIGTDDASLVERLGIKVRMVEGDRTNFKITYPLDLKLAKLLIKKEQK